MPNAQMNEETAEIMKSLKNDFGYIGLVTAGKALVARKPAEGPGLSFAPVDPAQQAIANAYYEQIQTHESVLKEKKLHLNE